MVDRAVKLQSKSTSYDLAQVTHRLANSKIQDLTRLPGQMSYLTKQIQAAPEL